MWQNDELVVGPPSESTGDGIDTISADANELGVPLPGGGYSWVGG